MNLKITTIHANDSILITKSLIEIEHIKDSLSKIFKIKDLCVARATCPDIAHAHAMGIASKFNAAPMQAHLTVVKRIFK